MAAGDLPPYVVSGQPIASVWGNAVVDELARDRNEVWSPWASPGGAYLYLGNCDVGTISPSPSGVSYPCRMTVIGMGHFGYSACGIAADFGILPWNGAGGGQGQNEYVPSGYYRTQTVVVTWDVAAGGDCSFVPRVRWNATEAGGVTLYASAVGIYHRQRTGSP